MSNLSYFFEIIVSTMGCSILFRIFVLQEKTQKTLSTLRYRTFAIGAYFEKVGDTIKLKIALTKKRRKWFESLWNYPIDLTKEIPNA